jgi:RHS repeat-associated protein
VTDRVGSVRLVVRASDGAIVERIDYDQFGAVLDDTNPGFQPFGFAGGLYDRDTGLVRLGARDYDPRTGRFTTRDPQGFAGGSTNLYEYAGGDPVNVEDPYGTHTLTVSTGAHVEGGTGLPQLPSGAASVDAGIAISRDDRGGFHLGGYVTYGGYGDPGDWARAAARFFCIQLPSPDAEARRKGYGVFGGSAGLPSTKLPSIGYSNAQTPNGLKDNFDTFNLRGGLIGVTTASDGKGISTFEVNPGFQGFGGSFYKTNTIVGKIF